MGLSSTTRRKAAASVALSVALHCGALVVLAIEGSHPLGPGDRGEMSELDLNGAFALTQNAAPERPMPPAAAPTEVKPEPEAELPPLPPEFEEMVRLGIDDGSESVKEVWQGAAKATEHSAPKSEVEMPAQAITPGLPQPATPGQAGSQSPEQTSGEQMGPDQPTPMEQAAAAAEAKEAQLESRQDLPLQVEPKQPLPPQNDAQQDKPQQPDASPALMGPSQIQLPKQQPDKQQPLPKQDKPVQDQDQQTQPVQPKDKQEAQQPQQGSSGGAASKASPPAAQPAQANAPDAMPGEKSQQETWASSVVETLTYRPGRPLAGKGLQVRTVAPRYGVTTMLIAAPKDTVVRITFGKTGKVLRAAFVDSGTGYADVDGPLLDAVYRWTAQGEDLKKIPEGDPHAGLTFDIKFLMGR